MNGLEVFVLVVVGNMSEVNDGLRKMLAVRLHGRNGVGGADQEQERDQGLQGGADRRSAKRTGERTEQKADGEGDLQYA